jgi:hypothetical protein
MSSRDYSYEDAVRRYGRNNVENCNSKETPNLYRVWCKPGVRYRRAVCPHSEVCMHMKVAGRPMDFELLAGTNGYPPSVQLYSPDTDNKFSSPITYGEAGVYYAGPERGGAEPASAYYFYPRFPAPADDPQVNVGDVELLNKLGVDII